MFTLRRTVSIVVVAACAALIVGLFVWTRSFRTAPSEYASAVPVSGVTWQIQPDQTQLDWSMYNESGADLLFGEQMALEYRKDGTWVEVAPEPSRLGTFIYRHGTRVPERGKHTGNIFFE